MTLIRRISEVAPGNPGILQTVLAMRSQVLNQPDPAPVLALAQQLEHTLPVGQQTPYNVASAVYYWVQSHLTYTEDTVPDPADALLPPVGLIPERIRNPKYLLWLITHVPLAPGDCDDYVVLMVALWLAADLPARFVVTSARPDQEYDHVFARVGTERGWITGDAIHGAPFGWDVRIALPRSVTASLELPV